MLDRPQNKHLRPDRPGEVRNPKGRPKGSKHRLTEAFWRELTDAWHQHGRAALDKLATEDPATFVRVAASVMPKHLEIEEHSHRSARDLSDDELARLICEGEEKLRK